MRFVYVASAEPEWNALFVLLILLAFSLSDRYATSRTHMFRAAVIVVILSIASNILTIMCWPQAAQLPRSLVYGLNMVYFLITPLSEVFVCAYVLMETFSGRRTSRGFLIALTILIASYAAFVPVVLTNGQTGLVFVLDETNTYFRGRANWLNLALVLVDVLVVVVNFFLQRRNTERSFRAVMVALPILATGMAIYQQLSPMTQLSGTCMSLVLLVLFISCQRRRVNLDSLTGAGTRDAFFQQLNRLIDAKQNFTLQVITLCHFKRINRRFGIAVGDELLQAIVVALRQIYPGNLCYRYSDTSFIVLHHHLATDVSNSQMSRLRARFTEPWSVGNVVTPLWAVFAEASAVPGGTSREELLTGLEYCIHRARERAIGSLVVFTEELRKQMVDREHMTEMIQTALTSDRFFLCYQPIYDTDGKLCAAEALLRLRDTDGKIVSPGLFIPLAEETGSIVQLTWVVLDKVCDFLSRNRDADLPPISINFSAQQFAERDMVAIINRYLSHYDVPANRLKIEITERVFTENDHVMRKNVHQMQEEGLGLYLDDFGTGYSNLSRVSRLPFEVIKIDKSMLSGSENTKMDNLLHVVISGLKSLGVKVLMEGVETAEQLKRVKNMGVDRIQGFYFSRPLEEADFLACLAADNDHTPANAG